MVACIDEELELSTSHITSSRLISSHPEYSCYCFRPWHMKFNLGLRPYDKVVYDRNLQALVDKIFPNFSLQVLLHDYWSSCTFLYTVNVFSNRIFNTQDKLLEEQFNAAYDHEEASNNVYDLPQVTRQPISLKRPLQQEINKSVLPPAKKPKLSGNTSSTGGASSSGNRSALSSNKSSSAGGDSKAVEEFSGLTLRVVPYEPSSNPISSDTANSSTSLLSLQESALAPLTRPLLKVNRTTVAVDQIQRFIHKRLGGPEAFLPKAIEILRDGVVQHSSWRIGQTPHSPNASVIDAPNSSARPDGTIILAYRRKWSVQKQDSLVLHASVRPAYYPMLCLCMRHLFRRFKSIWNLFNFITADFIRFFTTLLSFFRTDIS